MLEEKFYSGENIENKKPYINYISENRWKVGNHIFSNSDEKCIYIQNQYPSNFYSLSKCKNQFSCGICKQTRQSKIWFGLNQEDYDLGCIHIKELISAIYWGRENINISNISTGMLPFLEYRVPRSYIEVERAKILLCNLCTPLTKQIYFIRNEECLIESEASSASYNIISYPELKWNENIVSYNKRQYNCTCKHRQTRLFNNKYVCEHIIKVVQDEEIKSRKLDLVLFLVNKYFEN